MSDGSFEEMTIQHTEVRSEVKRGSGEIAVEVGLANGFAPQCGLQEHKRDIQKLKGEVDGFLGSSASHAVDILENSDGGGEAPQDAELEDGLCIDHSGEGVAEEEEELDDTFAE